jgi:leukotriene-A4 hydrolase
MARLDPHSYTDSTHARTRSLQWKARVDFTTKALVATATLTFDAPGSGPLDLDTRGLHIERVCDEHDHELTFSLAPPDAVLGSRLRVQLPANTRSITIAYRTSPDASALQWLSPTQTAGRKEPFLFSQCQAIHARSVVPLQDTPRVRIQYHAELTVPAALRALMAAAFVGRVVNGDEAVETWEMPQPIAPYLLAFAVGDLTSQDVGPRSRVWSEPSLIKAAAWEFAEINHHLQVGVDLFGPYDWDRFDVLVMPPSFPYGGMENPRLTFLTPTLLAGDRSQVRVVAHELAHSWTGNLITNADAQHFWLNEGWTRYAEVRIVEATEGPDAFALQMALGRRGLDRAIERFQSENRLELTHLRTHLQGIDPDDAFSEVPYDKGCLFLMAIEAVVGRERFDLFIREYIAAFRFGAITTEEFVAFTERSLPGVLEQIRAPEWIDGPGIPDNAPVFHSTLLESIESLKGAVPDVDVAMRWSASEWQLYLESIPTPASHDTAKMLDARFDLTRRKNYEVLCAWLQVAIPAGYDAVLPRSEALLGEVGRMKFLKPIYRALLARPETASLARNAFERHASSYHPIARGIIASLLAASV